MMMTNMKDVVPFNKSIRFKIMVLVLSIMTPFIALFGYQTVKEYQGVIDAELESSLELAEAFSSSFLNYLDQVWLTELAIGQAITAYDELDVRATEAYLTILQSKQSLITGLAWMDPQGNVKASTVQELYNHNFYDREYVQRILSGEETVVSSIITSKLDKEAILPAARGIYKGGRLEGIVVAVIDVRQMDLLFPKRNMYETMQYGLVDHSGTLVYRSGSPDISMENRKIPSSSPIWQALKTGEMVKTYSHKSELDGVMRFGVDYPIRSIGWDCFVTVAVEEKLAVSKAHSMEQLTLLLLVAVTALITAFLFSREIVRPVLQLYHTARKYMSGETKARISVFSQDELGVTGRAFNTMLDHIQLKIQEAEEEKSKVKAILDAMPVGVTIADATGRISEWNELFNQIWGNSQMDNRQGSKDYASYVGWWADTGRLIQAEDWAMVRALKKGEVSMGEVIDIQRFDGGRATILNSAAPIFSPDGAIIGGVVTIMDITSRRKLESRLEDMVEERTEKLTLLHEQLVVEMNEKGRLQQEIYRMDRLNLIGQLAAGIGHEIRNPMTTVRGFLQLLQQKPEYGKEKAFFNIMIDELDRANGIISEFLSLARNKPLNLEPTDLNAIIQTLYPLIEAEANLLSHRVELKLAPLPPLPLDEKEIRQLLLNICRNALEAMEQPGVVTVMTNTNTLDGSVVLTIADEGPGIPTEVLEKLGKPFFTTKEGGTGLGLSICYDIAAHHNARLTASSSPEGTVFTISFAVSDTAA